VTFEQYQRALGRRIRTARWVLGWTQEDAAAKTKLTFRYFAELERGRANPTMATLFDLARAFGRRVVEFVDVEGPPERGHITLADAEASAEPPPRGRKPRPRRRRSSKQ
jgi:transcriptional regulator with XRE-family HTH domain